MFKTEQDSKRLLIVEPNNKTQKTILDFLRQQYHCEKADSLDDAFDMIAETEFEVVISNFDLRETNALELLSSIQFLSPDTSVIFLSENNSADQVIKAFRAGVFDFICQPFELAELESSIERALVRCRSQRVKETQERLLEKLVEEQNESLDRALKNIETSYRTTLKTLIQALETRDSETHGHSERVVTFSLRLAHELGLEKEKMRDLELGALLHDIGKIGVPDAILRKPAKLNEREWEKMKLHPLHGYNILKNIPFLEGAAKVVAQHHERWDGRGYPYQLRGENIDLIARIFAVADAFDAMISDRVYRQGRTFEDAVIELEKHSGTQFDPVVVAALKMFREKIGTP